MKYRFVDSNVCFIIKRFRYIFRCFHYHACSFTIIILHICWLSSFIFLECINSAYRVLNTSLIHNADWSVLVCYFPFSPARIASLWTPSKWLLLASGCRSLRHTAKQPIREHSGPTERFTTRPREPYKKEFAARRTSRSLRARQNRDEYEKEKKRGKPWRIRERSNTKWNK